MPTEEKIQLTKSEIRVEMRDMKLCLQNKIGRLDDDLQKQISSVREELVEMRAEMNAVKRFLTFLVLGATLLAILVDIAIKTTLPPL